MTRSLASALALVLLVAGCVGGASGDSDKGQPAPTAEATQETGAIQGSVVTDEIQPIQGAQIALLKTNFTGRSGEDGAFAISKIEPGTYTLLAGRIGYFDKTQRLDVKPGEVTKVQVILDRIPISEPSFNETMKFGATLIANDLCSQFEEPTKGITWTDFTFPINASKPDGTPLAAVNTLIDLKSTPASATIDVDMVLFGPDGKEIARSESPGANENIEHGKLLPAGEYRVLVCLWAGANAEFKIDVTITYEQGESATYAAEKGKK